MKKFVIGSMIAMLLTATNVGFASHHSMQNSVKKTPDIVSAAVNTPSLSTLVSAVQAGGLVETLQGKGPFTVFAPNNDAFAKIDQATLTTLLKPENKDQLVNLLTYHVVPGRYPVGRLRDGMTLTTVQGETLTVSKTRARRNGRLLSVVTLTDARGNKSRIVTRNIALKNGFVHIVDNVVMPKDTSLTDIVNNAGNAPALSTLVSAVQAGGLVETLKGTGPFTVLAPDNAAFAKIDQATLTTLLKPENKDQLTKILTYHVIAGAVRAQDLTDGQIVTTVQGGKLTVKKTNNAVQFVDENGGVATVTTANIEASNGVIHVIDSVVMPK